jgi:L,D-peptidoglycan transpeptidase YkuD (ErfK/YbiS/YcfS/YnhG family)
MTIILKNKGTLLFDDFIFRCVVGKNGLTKNKIEGDKKTPIGTFSIGNLYYRNDRYPKPSTKLKCIPIKKDMGWCDDIKNKNNYNQLIKINKNIKHEKLFRSDYKYDFIIPINYNTKKPKIGRGSAIFIHLTKKYQPTSGCIALKKKDFLILIKLINKRTQIKLN